MTESYVDKVEKLLIEKRVTKLGITTCEGFEDLSREEQAKQIYNILTTEGIPVVECFNCFSWVPKNKPHVCES